MSLCLETAYNTELHLSVSSNEIKAIGELVPFRAVLKVWRW